MENFEKAVDPHQEKAISLYVHTFLVFEVKANI
jgi:hypothetical protein